MTREQQMRFAEFMQMTEEEQYALPIEEYDAMVELAGEIEHSGSIWENETQKKKDAEKAAFEPTDDFKGLHRIRMLAVIEILKQYSNEKIGLTLADIRSYLLKDYEITIDEKRYRGIPADLRAFMRYEELFDGYELREEHGRYNRSYFKMVKRPFHYEDIRFLMDAVYSSRSIPDKAAKLLVQKLGRLTDVHTARLLTRGTVYKQSSVTNNEAVMDSLSAILRAIGSNQTICFDYYSWQLSEQESELRPVLKQKSSYHEEYYICHPQAVFNREANYYLIAYMEPVSQSRQAWMGTFRVDKMMGVELSEHKRISRLTKRELEQQQSQVFQAYRTDNIKKYRLAFDASMINVLVDHFGTDIRITRKGEHYETVVDIDTSPMFYGWLASFGTRIRIVEDKKAKEYQAYLEEIVQFLKQDSHTIDR